MNISVKIRGLKELEAKAGYSVLVQPEMEEVMDKLVGRVERPTKRLGFRRNTLSVRSQAGLSRTVATTLHFPRTTGKSWQQKAVGSDFGSGYLKAYANNLLRKTVKNIEARWAA